MADSAYQTQECNTLNGSPQSNQRDQVQRVAATLITIVSNTAGSDLLFGLLSEND